jgi:hypothetical protein
MMQELETLAETAILKAQSNPFMRKFGTTPVVQIWQDKPLSEFPVEYEYLGYRKGKHVYNLDARQLLQYIERYKLEFHGL